MLRNGSGLFIRTISSETLFGKLGSLWKQKPMHPDPVTNSETASQTPDMSLEDIGKLTEKMEAASSTKDAEAILPFMQQKFLKGDYDMDSKWISKNSIKSMRMI
jgi:hypothetical protein